MRTIPLRLRSLTTILTAASLVMAAFATAAFPTDPRDIDAGDHCKGAQNPSSCCYGACYEIHRGAPQHEAQCDRDCHYKAIGVINPI